MNNDIIQIKQRNELLNKRIADIEKKYLKQDADIRKLMTIINKLTKTMKYAN